MIILFKCYAKVKNYKSFSGFYERERERVPILSFGFCFAFLKKKKN